MSDLQARPQAKKTSKQGAAARCCRKDAHVRKSEMRKIAEGEKSSFASVAAARCAPYWRWRV